MPRTLSLHAPLPLDDLVAGVGATDEDGHDARSGMVLRVVGQLDHSELGLWPLHGRHPLAALVGFTAPTDWQAIGVHCTGQAYSLDSPPRPYPVVITTLVDRSGRGAGRMRPLDAAHRDDADHEAMRRFAVPAEGLIGDACRRALGLPTPPPPDSTAELWLRLWFDRAVEAAAFPDDDRPAPGWDDLAALHPAVALCRAAGSPPDRPGDPQALVDATLELAETWTWAALRRDPEVLAFAAPPVARDDAAWMDDGMFARVVLGDLAPLPVAGRSLGRLLPEPLVHDLADVIIGTGLAR